MIVQHNLTALFSQRQLGITNKEQAKSSKKLASGYKINQAADDAAGLSISEKMRQQINGLNKASANAQSGISVIQIAEGALTETQGILQRMNELATQAANDTNTTADRTSIKNEIDQLASEIDRIASTTQFNSMNLIDGSFKTKNLQVGALSGQNIQLDIYGIDVHGLGLTMPINDMSDNDWDLLAQGFSVQNIRSIVDYDTAYYRMGVRNANAPSERGLYVPDQCLLVDTNQHAGGTMLLTQNAVEMVSEMRSNLGAIQNRLEHTIANLDTSSENVQASESRIRDTDMASEMVNYSKHNILSQAGQSILAQANQNTQGVLSLLG